MYSVTEVSGGHGVSVPCLLRNAPGHCSVLLCLHDQPGHLAALHTLPICETALVTRQPMGAIGEGNQSLSLRAAVLKDRGWVTDADSHTVTVTQ